MKEHLNDFQTKLNETELACVRSRRRVVCVCGEGCCKNFQIISTFGGHAHTSGRLRFNVQTGDQISLAELCDEDMLGSLIK